MQIKTCCKTYPLLTFISEPTTCDVTEFRCSSGHCISSDLFCNGEHDCDDGSDESGCKVCEPHKEIFCPAARKCLPIANRCDGLPQCADGSDEMYCDNRNISLCADNEFACSLLDCLPKVYFLKLLDVIVTELTAYCPILSEMRNYILH